jgi:CheY-like chemotaxis protein
MDGWETCHLIRNVHQSDVHICIISANAFDRNLENSSGILPSDFVLKPVNLMELINWIGERLNLEWIQAEDERSEIKQITDSQQPLPEKQVLESLLEMLDLGYIMGLKEIIDELDSQGTVSKSFISEMRRMAESFQLENMKQFIKEKLQND